MELASHTETLQEMVAERLKALSGTERILLVEKFTRLTEADHRNLDSSQRIKVVQKTLLLKFSKDALVESFLSGHTSVDSPGNRLNDFLIRELSGKTAFNKKVPEPNFKQLEIWPREGGYHAKRDGKFL